jgi:hypothetical protein
MITRKEYLKALEIVDQYNRQLNSSNFAESIHVKTYDLNKGDYIENVLSKSKYVTIGKKYMIIDCIHIHTDVWGGRTKTMDNYSFTYAHIIDDFGKKRRMISSNGKLWKKV